MRSASKESSSRRARILRARLFFVLAAGLPAAASLAEDTAKQNPDAVARGRALYAHHCSHCHGFNMVNAGNISYDLRKFPRDDKARFMNSVLKGKGGMPPWSGTLSAEQIDQLWAFVMTGGKP